MQTLSLSGYPVEIMRICSRILSKFVDSDFVGNEPSPIKEKDKTTSQPQVDYYATNAIRVCSSYEASQPLG
jgi:hypothetical protein